MSDCQPEKGDNVPEGHPLEVSTDSIHFALLNADLRAVIEERLFCVVHTT